MRYMLVTLGLLTIIWTGLFAQTAKFIEITVEDTVMINSTGILYQIFLYDEEYLSDLSEEESYKLLGKDELETILNELNIQQYKDYATEFSVQIAKPNQSIDLVVLIDDLDILEHCYKRIRGYNNVYGNILEFQFNQLAAAEAELIQKVIEKGIRKAGKIGGLVDKEIGELLSMEEEHTENLEPPAPCTSVGWTFYPPLSALPNEAAKPRKARSILRKRVKLSFAWE